MSSLYSQPKMEVLFSLHRGKKSDEYQTKVTAVLSIAISPPTPTPSISQGSHLPLLV